MSDNEEAGVLSKHPDLKHEQVEKKDKKHKKDKKKKREVGDEDDTNLANLEEDEINAQIAKLQNELAGQTVSTLD